jgi:hypothetical protein
MAPSTSKRFPKVIYFINDFNPTDAEMEAAGEIGPGVVFRNGQYVPENPSPGSIEACDFVAGENIPKPYADRYDVWNGEVGTTVEKTVDEGTPLFDHANDGTEPPFVKVVEPGIVPTSETATPIDPATNLPLDADGKPIQPTPPLDPNAADLVAPATASTPNGSVSGVTGNDGQPVTGRADTTAHERNAPASVGTPAPTTPPAAPSPAPATPAKAAPAPKPVPGTKATPPKPAAGKGWTPGK